MKGLLLVGLIVGLVFSGMAQEKADTLPVLTFEEAVKIGLMRSVTLNQQKNQLELSQILKTASIVQLGPTVSINATAQQTNGNQFNQQQGRVVNGVADNVSGSISANLNLFSGFSSIYTLKQYANLLDAQSYFVARTAQDVINTVATQYLQVLLDVELLRIAQENFEVQNTQLQQIHEFVQVGSKAPVDEYNQDALTKAAELAVVQAEITLNNDKALLTQTLMIDPFDDFNVVKPSWDVNVLGNENLDRDKMLATAKLHRGDYLQTVKQEAGRKYAMKASKGYMVPSLYAFGNYGSAYNYQHSIPDSVAQREGLNRPFDSQFRKDNVYKSYGLQLQIPLFRGLQNRTTYVQQRVIYENSILATKNLEILLKNDVQKSRRNFEGIKKAYTISTDQLLAAEEAYKLETERYNLGVTNLIEYSTANRAFIQAQTNHAQALYRLLFQKIQMEYALGTLKIEDFQ